MDIWVIGALAVALLLALLYWLVVIAEGAYFGPWAVRIVYRLGAPHYDSIRAAPIRADAVDLLPVLCTAIAHIGQPRVLDVATGTGRVPLLLAAVPGFSGTIDALDLTVQMLDRAQAKQQQFCPTAPIHWHVGEAGHLAWPAAHFDLVTCLEALEYFPRPRRALAEMVRVLRPDGVLVLSKVPDVWARLLPLRAFSHSAMQRELTQLGLVDVQISPWQPGHYELVTARKPAVKQRSHG